MILDLKEAFVTEGLNRSFAYELDLSGLEVPGGECPLSEPVKVSGMLFNKAGVVGLHIEIGCILNTVCDRCCAPMKEPLRIILDNVVVKELSGDGEDFDNYIVAQGDRLDLDETVTTGIILNLPMKHLCSESCRGLCPKCGKNLNEGDCGCGQSIVLH